MCKLSRTERNSVEKYGKPDRIISGIAESVNCSPLRLLAHTVSIELELLKRKGSPMSLLFAKPMATFSAAKHYRLWPISSYTYTFHHGL